MINKNYRDLSLPSPNPTPRLRVLNAEGDVVEWTPENDEFFMAATAAVEAREVAPGMWTA